VSSPGGEIAQQDLRLSFTVTWTFPLSILVAGAGIEVRPRVVWQQVSPEGSAALTRLYGSRSTSERALVVGVGPAATLSLPVHDRWSLGLWAGAGLEAAPDASGRTTTRWYAEPRLLLGWSY
jgi:hypothetical protein